MHALKLTICVADFEKPEKQCKKKPQTYPREFDLTSTAAINTEFHEDSSDPAHTEKQNRKIDLLLE